MTRILLLMTLVLGGSGCALVRPPADFGPRAKRRIPQGVTKEHLVQHLNRNIQGTATSGGLASWRSTDIKIASNALPPGVRAPASIAVKAPRNLRLIVSNPLLGGEALDMGSNLAHFWIWAKDAQPQQVITVDHNDIPAAQQILHVPFHPDWLMEVLGVIPIDPSRYELRPRPTQNPPTLELVSNLLSPLGEPQSKVIRVHACHGIILEHALYDDQGDLVARAALAEHRIDPATGLVVPHVIRLDWPDTGQQLTMSFGNVELNPPTMPEHLWMVPNKPGSPRLDLSQVLHGQQSMPPTLGNVGGPLSILPPGGGAAFHPVDHEQARHGQPVPRSSITSSLQRGAIASGNEPPGVVTFSAERKSASGPPSGYSPAASQSSSAPRRREPGLLQRLFR